MMLSHVDLIDQLLEYNRKTTPNTDIQREKWLR